MATKTRKRQEPDVESIAPLPDEAAKKKQKLLEDDQEEQSSEESEDETAKKKKRTKAGTSKATAKFVKVLDSASLQQLADLLAEFNGRLDTIHEENTRMHRSSAKQIASLTDLVVANINPPEKDAKLWVISHRRWYAHMMQRRICNIINGTLSAEKYPTLDFLKDQISKHIPLSEYGVKDEEEFWEKISSRVREEERTPSHSC